jgi:hypothetical protein
MPTTRHNDDLWERLEVAGASADAGPAALLEIQRDTAARIHLWREIIRAAEEEADRVPGDPRPRRFADAGAEADRARRALADVLALRARIERLPARAGRGAGGRA